jgi:hypothetical protein
MPLSTPAARKPVHTRAITCSSYARDDGLWDIEGHLTDVKAYPFKSVYRGEVKAGEPVHDMWLRLTVDSDFVIQDVEAVTDAGPYAACPAITPAFVALKGLKIEAGWNRKVRERVGGVKGCTHLVDLIRPMATVAFHTIRWSDSAPTKNRRAAKERPPLNTCHVWASDGELVRREHPDYYTGSTAPVR